MFYFLFSYPIIITVCAMPPHQTGSFFSFGKHCLFWQFLPVWEVLFSLYFCLGMSLRKTFVFGKIDKLLQQLYSSSYQRNNSRNFVFIWYGSDSVGTLFTFDTVSTVLTVILKVRHQLRKFSLTIFWQLSNLFSPKLYRSNTRLRKLVWQYFDCRISFHPNYTMHCPCFGFPGKTLGWKIPNLLFWEMPFKNAYIKFINYSRLLLDKCTHHFNTCENFENIKWFEIMKY